MVPWLCGILRCSVVMCIPYKLTRIEKNAITFCFVGWSCTFRYSHWTVVSKSGCWNSIKKRAWVRHWRFFAHKTWQSTTASHVAKRWVPFNWSQSVIRYRKRHTSGTRRTMGQLEPSQYPGLHIFAQLLYVSCQTVELKNDINCSRRTWEDKPLKYLSIHVVFHKGIPWGVRWSKDRYYSWSASKKTPRACWISNEKGKRF